MSKKNQYEKRSAKKSLLSGISPATKENLKESGWDTLKDIAVGVVGGGLATALIGSGPISFIIGALVTGAGHYTGRKLISSFGVGMMASNSFKKTDSTNTQNVSGTENQGMIEEAKNRMLAFKDQLAEKVMLDKLLKKKETSGDGTTNGMGETQYFTYPDETNKTLSEGKVDLTALEELERKVVENASEYSKNEPVKGILTNQETMGNLDPADKNY